MCKEFLVWVVFLFESTETMMSYQQEYSNPAFKQPETNYPSESELRMSAIHGIDNSQQQPISPITMNSDGSVVYEPIHGTSQAMYSTSLQMSESVAMQGSSPVAMTSSVTASGSIPVATSMSVQGYDVGSAPSCSMVPMQGYVGDVASGYAAGCTPSYASGYGGDVAPGYMANGGPGYATGCATGYVSTPTQGYVMQYDPASTPGYTITPMQMQQVQPYPGMYQDPSLQQQPSPADSTQSQSSVQSLAKGTVNTLKTIGTSVGKMYGQFWVRIRVSFHS